MKKSTKIWIAVVVILLLIGIGGGIYYFVFIKEKKPDTPPVKEVIVTNTIEEYGYNLEDRDTENFKQKFEELKTLLQNEDYDKMEYMRLISELFIMDFFTIQNKVSRYDVGGLEYVYKDAVDSFRTVAESSVYKTVENNLDDTRTQELPVVVSATSGEITETTFEMPDKSNAGGYRVPVSWEYEENLGYDTSGVLILIPDGNKMGVVFYKAN